jgi:hypothetical protein
MGNTCGICGANLDLVGVRHRCVPRPRIKELAEGWGERAALRQKKLEPHVAALDKKIRAGRPRLGEVRDKPWVAAGMSRATWFRRKKSSWRDKLYEDGKTPDKAAIDMAAQGQRDTLRVVDNDLDENPFEEK